MSGSVAWEREKARDRPAEHAGRQLGSPPVPGGTSSQAMRRWNTSPKAWATVFAACWSEGARPVRRSRLVTPFSGMPQGTMWSKKRRSVERLSANPCCVMCRVVTFTPMAAIFSFPTQTPVWRRMV